MLEQSEFVGAHQTEPRYTMCRLGQFPAVVARGDTAIIGELYRIENDVFALLDELECYPQVFSRQVVDTPAGDAWMYVYNRLVGTEQVVGHGDWLRFLESGE
jgi:gamma-glutamylcyclotransferase (GGCT)/AIG2-like uncharacterized protein YtfP